MSSPLSSNQKDVITTDDPATAIFTSFAKVYTMNPNNKSFWLPSSSTAVPVSFYFDKHRSVYRIISYDKKDLVVNSTIFPSMTFIKTSATFGLWSDSKLRTIYGLGFSSNENLMQFAEWFEKITIAAKKLEDNLPLPPPAPSAVSISGDDNSNMTSSLTVNPQTIGPPETDLVKHENHLRTMSSSVWYDSDTQRNYMVPTIDSTIDLSASRGEGDYEVDQMTTSPMAKLALENLQYQREVLKVKQLEIELHAMRTTANTMHEGLQKKSVECEKLRKDLADSNTEIEELKRMVISKEDEIAKLQEMEVGLKDQIQELNAQTREKDNFIQEKKDEVNYLKNEVDRAEEVRKENDILKERLRQLQAEFDVSDKNWDVVEMASCDMTDVIEGLIGLQTRIKQVVPTHGGDM